MSERIIPLKVSGYHIGITGDGDAGSLSAASVVFQPVFDETWADMVITARFVDAAHDKTIDILQPNDLALTDGVWSIAMPTEASAYEGDAELSFIGVIVEGTTVTKRQTTKPIRLHIFESNAARDGTNTAPIAPTDAQQIHQMSLVAEAWAQGTKDGEPDGDYADKNAKYHAETSEAWAVGTRGGVADPERATDNAKYYAETVAQGHADDAAESALDAEDWAVGTRGGVTDPDHAEDNSKHYAENAAASATLSESYAKGGTGTRTDEDADNAKKYAENALGSASDAARLAATAEEWATGGSGGTPSSVNNAANYARQAKSWAIGATGIRPGEDTNNAKYYSEQSAGSASLARDWAIGDDEHAGESAKDYAEAAERSADAAADAVEAAMEENIAAVFDPSEDYAVGDYCMYEGGLIRFTAAKAGDGEDVTPGTYVGVAVTDDLKKKYELPQGGIPTAHIADGAITTDKINDYDITAEKLTSDSVTTTKIVDGAVTNAKLGSKAVKTANIDDGAVGTDQLASAVKNTISGKADSSTLAASGGAALIGATAPSGLSGDDVQEVLNSAAAEIAAKYELPQGGIPGTDIADGAVGADQLAQAVKDEIASKYEKPNGGITGADIATNTITGGAQGNIGRGAVDAINLATGSVRPSKILDEAVETEKIKDGAVTKVKLADDVLAAIYNTYATDGAAGALGFHTTLGADDIPVKTATVKQTAGTPTTWTLRRTGKNLFDKVNVVFEKGLFLGSDGSETHGSANYSATVSYIPIVPGSRIVASGLADALGGSTCTVSLYDESKAFIERKTGWGSGKDPYFTASGTRGGVEVPAYYMRFNVANGMVPEGTTKINQSLNVQFEIVDDPAATAAAATAYAPYTQTDYTVPVTALDTPTAPTETPTTILGDNVFVLIGQADATATMDITARLDPTLVYNQLRAAIVAAGAT